MLRFGLGIDVHPLVPDRPLILGGVRVPSPLGLAGHSDADVLVHALMDALLGAAGLGDIGQHFPSGDPAYAGADSMLLLKRVMTLLGERGFSPRQADCTLLAEKPELAPYYAAIKENLARALSLPLDRVSVKATTTEKLGFIGRGEGMAALVLAVVEAPD